MLKKSLVILMSLFLLSNCSNKNSDESSNTSNCLSTCSESLSLESEVSSSSEVEKSSESIESESDSESNESSLSSENIDNSEAQVIFNQTDTTKLEEENEILLNKTTFTRMGNYKTGNYSNWTKGSDINTINNISFEHYRALKSTTDIFSLLPYYDNEEDGSYSGAFYNTTQICSISRMFINYKTNEDEENGFVFNYGEDRYTTNSITLPSYSEYSCVEIDFTNTGYFKIETIKQELFVKDITIYYVDQQLHSNDDYKSSGENEYRLQPVRYCDTLVDGESYVEVPINVNFDKTTMTYEVLETKKYTYYSYEYVVNHPEVASDAAMTEPKDVINYYLAFNQYPANYFSSAKNALKGEAGTIFGNSVRQVSQYSRTDGYVLAVPAIKENIAYLEFDIDIGNTYITAAGSVSRGTARVVIFLTGFDDKNYDSSPVGVYTDDHYATFQEYLNTGSFGKRFNSECHRTIYQWGSPLCF